MVRHLIIVTTAVALSGLIAGLVPVDGLEPPAVFLFVLLVETILAVIIWWASGRSSPDVARPFDARPADGVVPLVALAGVRGRANEINPDIQAFVQSIEPTPASPSPRLRRGLVGRLGVFSLFLGRDGASWSDREVAEAYEGIAKMGRWLEREAARWEVPVNVELIDTYFRGDDDTEEAMVLAQALDPYRNVLDEADADVRGLASASRVSAALGFSDLADLITTIDPRADHDLTVWFIHLLRAGRSSAVREDRFQFPGVGIALCYARESSFSEPLGCRPYVDPITLAHELLHLFGATDKYGTSLATFPDRSVTGCDIMRLDERRLSKLRIDPLTAAEIGWVALGEVSKRERPTPKGI